LADEDWRGEGEAGEECRERGREGKRHAGRTAPAEYYPPQRFPSVYPIRNLLPSFYLGLIHLKRLPRACDFSSAAKPVV